MAAGEYDFEIEQGADFTRTLTWKNADGTLVNLTGYTAKLQIRDAKGGLVLELSTANGRITLGGALGTITLTLLAAVTETLVPTTGFTRVHDLELTSAGGTITRLVQGRVAVSKQVTV